MSNPFNPLEWVRLAQDWFRKTERSSGFRPYLIFLLILLGFAVVMVSMFPNHALTSNVLPLLLQIGVIGFVVLFAVKAFQDPNFCRSEKHVENVRRLGLMEQKGDKVPTLIAGAILENSENPEPPRIEVFKDAQQ